VLERFEDEDAGAFADDEAVALGVERTAGALGLVIARGERFHGRETADAHGGDGGFAAAADHDLGITTLDEAEGIAHGMRGSRTGGGGGGIGPASAVANGDDAGSKINDGGRNEKRRDAAGAALEKLAMLALDDVESADSGSDVDAGSVGGFRDDFEMGHAHGEIGAGHGQLNEPAHFFQLFFGDPEERIEIADLGSDAAIKGGGVKMGDRPDAALAGENFLPDLVGADAQGTDQSDTGDHDTTAQRGNLP
jgi:hypothetical protein